MNPNEKITHFDPFLFEAAQLAVSLQKGSISDIQRKLMIGYHRVLLIVDSMEELGIVHNDVGVDCWTSQINEQKDLNLLFRKMIPNAETYLLGGLLLNNDLIPFAISILRYNHFIESRHLLIYMAIIQLWLESRSIDVLSVSERLARDNVLDRVGGPGFVTTLAAQGSTSHSLIHLCAHLLKAEEHERNRIRV
jgi:hypothetical protein